MSILYNINPRRESRMKINLVGYNPISCYPKYSKGCSVKNIVGIFIWLDKVKIRFNLRVIVI